MEHIKLNIVLGFYKHLLEEKLKKLNNFGDKVPNSVLTIYKPELEEKIRLLENIETVNSYDVFKNHINYSDLNRLHQLKHIDGIIYNDLFSVIKKNDN